MDAQSTKSVLGSRDGRQCAIQAEIPESNLAVTAA